MVFIGVNLSEVSWLSFKSGLSWFIGVFRSSLVFGDSKGAGFWIGCVWLFSIGGFYRASERIV